MRPSSICGSTAAEVGRIASWASWALRDLFL